MRFVHRFCSLAQTASSRGLDSAVSVRERHLFFKLLLQLCHKENRRRD